MDRDEWIEQAYFFRLFRERIEQGLAAQDILARAHDEILSTTRLPMAVQFLASEIKHHGVLAPAFVRLAHYFTPFQAFVIQQAESEKVKFTIISALLILEREATFKANHFSTAGLFVYQFESIARNKLGYDDGLRASAKDPSYSEPWRSYIDLVRRQVGTYDFSELVYVRSELYVRDKRRTQADYVPSQEPIFGEKEGKIAKASFGRDPLFLFAALQRQLNYPEVPRFREKDDLEARVLKLESTIREHESRIRILEAEQRGTFDPTQYGKPEMFRDIKDDE
jgi:hypothetical protein